MRLPSTLAQNHFTACSCAAKTGWYWGDVLSRTASLFMSAHAARLDSYCIASTYIQSEKRMSTPSLPPHKCHWPGCGLDVPPKYWGCRKHWFTLPIRLRNLIWSRYRVGQEVDKRPSPAYMEAAQMVQEWIRVHGEGL